MKCDICGKKIETTFLNKLIGTTIRDAKRKKRTVCSDCQRRYTKEELKTKL
jgi:ribosome-binding protein aMBF1 (putative translation factor)